MRYIALLRGVNVGGKNKISMPELKTAFLQNGFEDVKTYINSGNVLFSGEGGDLALLAARCGEIIRDTFKMNIAVAVLTADDLSAALGHAPEWWNTDEESKHNAIFVIPPATVESVACQVGEIKPEYEKVAYHGGVIFWSAPLKTFSRGRWAKVAGNSAYSSITIRNANTAIKLAELAVEPT